MKTTPFTHFHEALGARMAPFAGYNMPIEYPTGIKEEHLNVRNKLGVFDVSHMGEFWIKGPKAFELVQKLTTNDVAALIDGKVQYSCFPNDKGGIVDDLLVYRFSAEKYLLVVNAANIEKDWNWVVKYGAELGMKPGVELENASDNICQLAIQGPLALKAMQKLTSENVVDMEYYTFKEIPFSPRQVIPVLVVVKFMLIIKMLRNCGMPFSKPERNSGYNRSDWVPAIP